MIRAALLFALVAVAAAQIPARCFSPSQWQAQAMIRDLRRGGSVGVYSRYTYDATNKRIARFDEVDVNRTTSYYQVIELYEEGIYYEIDLKTKVCKKGQLEHPFIPHNVEANSTFRGDYILGSNAVEGAGVEIETWSHTFEHAGEKMTADMRFTRQHCVPTFFSLSTPNFFYEEFFFDTTIGISDPNAFVPPSQC